LLFESVGKSKYFIDFRMYTVSLTLFFILFVLVINHSAKWLVHPYLLFLGKISYSLYLTHQYVASRCIIPIATEMFGCDFWVAAFLIALPINIMIATIITFAIEMPVQRRMKKALYSIRDGCVYTVAP
jgi:peptidoglycan/LPS O-acetylase OafA/YrhL